MRHATCPCSMSMRLVNATCRCDMSIDMSMQYVYATCRCSMSMNHGWQYTCSCLTHSVYIYPYTCSYTCPCNCPSTAHMPFPMFSACLFTRAFQIPVNTSVHMHVHMSAHMSTHMCAHKCLLSFIVGSYCSNGLPVVPPMPPKLGTVQNRPYKSRQRRHTSLATAHGHAHPATGGLLHPCDARPPSSL